MISLSQKMRVLRVTLWLVLSCSTGFAESAGKEWLNVRDFGALGDGKALETMAINAAIAAASRNGGGTVYFPAGTYLSHTIHLRSHITIQFDNGAVLIAADPPAQGGTGGYDAPEENPHNLYQDFGHSHWRNSLIWGEDLENVAILGPGLIFGRGLSGGHSRKAPFPRTTHREVIAADNKILPDDTIRSGPFGYPRSGDTLPAGIGNKAIALKSCRNVILRDFTILHGGHFGILATGVDNLTIDNLTIDTNRDGIDIDACSNVRISNCSVNSPFDDAICLKSSYALGTNRPTENVLITNCFVSGFDEGTLVDGTRKRTVPYPTGRIKMGTESNGGFRNITISNCVFELSRGLALEQVDGGVLEDVTVTNITMRDIFNAPLFIRLGGRLRAPEGTEVGSIRRVRISNLVAHNVKVPGDEIIFSPQGILISGIPGHPIEDLTLSGIFMDFAGNGTEEMAGREVPELVDDYPEPGRFGHLPAWGLFARHVDRFTLEDVEFRLQNPDARPAVILDSGKGIRLRGCLFPVAKEGTGIPFALRNVKDLSIDQSRFP